jgi:anti-anti-sigma factor
MSELLTLDGAKGRLAGELTIYQAKAIKTTLLAAIGSQPRLEIDLSQVTGIDTAGVQLLLLAKREASRRGGELRLAGHSEPVIKVIDLLNIGGELGDPLVMTVATGDRT